MSGTIESCDYYACNRDPGEQHHLDCDKFPASPEQLAEELRGAEEKGRSGTRPPLVARSEEDTPDTGAPLRGHTTTWRDRVAHWACNWILNHIATQHYRDFIDGSIRYGVGAAIRDGQSVRRFSQARSTPDKFRHRREG